MSEQRGKACVGGRPRCICIGGGAFGMRKPAIRKMCSRDLQHKIHAINDVPKDLVGDVIRALPQMHGGISRVRDERIVQIDQEAFERDHKAPSGGNPRRCRPPPYRKGWAQYRSVIRKHTECGDSLHLYTARRKKKRRRWKANTSYKRGQ